MNDKKKKKEYAVPEADLIEFADEDIITLSTGTEKLDWGGGENEEPFGA